ncbi:MAG: hypothetical protein HRT73_01200 [Flavobacteriales bacterium]|nr:hypothetical protein [Flavobacteriales bacterium]
MKRNNNIDQFFKDKLEHREFELKDSFITDLEKKLDQKETKGVFWRNRAFYLVLLLLGFLAVGYYSFNVENKNNSKNIGVLKLSDKQEKESSLQEANHLKGEKKEVFKTVRENTVDNFNNDASKNEFKSSSLNYESDKGSSVNSRLSENKKTNPKSIINSDEDSKENTLFTEIDKRKDAANQNSFKNVEKDDNKKGESIVNFSNEVLMNKEVRETILTTEKKLQLNENEINENNDIQVENKTTKDDRVNNLNNTVSVVDSENRVVEENKIIDELVDSDLNNEHNNVNLDVEKDTISDENKLTKSNEVDSIQINVSDTDSIDDVLQDSISPVTPKKPSPDFKKWNISLFAGVAMISKTISGDASDTYFNKRKGEEANIATVNYGLELSYYLNKSINLSIGLNSLIYGEDINYSEIVDTKNVSVITSYNEVITFDSITGLDTTLVPVFSNQTVTDTTASFTDKNRYTYIHIPFMFGYKMSFNKFSLNSKIGGSYGRLIKSGGSYINTSLNAVEAVDLEKNIFNVILSTTVGYKIKKINYFIEPKYLFNISDVFINSEVKQSYKAFSISFGLSLKF